MTGQQRVALAKGQPAVAGPAIVSGVGDHACPHRVAVGFAGSERFSLAPDIPTFNEQGINFETEIFFAVLAPGSMPTDLVAQLNKTITAAMNNDNTKALLKKIGYDPAGGSPAELVARLDKRAKELTETAAAVGIKPL